MRYMTRYITNGMKKATRENYATYSFNWFINILF